MRKRKLPAAMLTLLAISASTLAIAGCGGEEKGSSSTKTTKASTTAGLKHKYEQSSKGYWTETRTQSRTSSGLQHKYKQKGSY